MTLVKNPFKTAFFSSTNGHKSDRKCYLHFTTYEEGSLRHEWKLLLLDGDFSCVWFSSQLLLLHLEIKSVDANSHGISTSLSYFFYCLKHLTFQLCHRTLSIMISRDDEEFSIKFLRGLRLKKFYSLRNNIKKWIFSSDDFC